MVQSESESCSVMSRLCATPWTVDCQAPLSVGCSRQECWSGLPCSPPGDLPDTEIEPRSSTLQADSLLSKPSGNFFKIIVFQTPLPNTH